MLNYIEINTANILHNIETFRSLLPKDTKLVSVIKANAYGHGQNEIAAIIESATDWFAVDDFEELVKLRTITSKPILVLGYVERENLEAAIEQNARLGMYDIERIQLVNSISAKKGIVTKIHIKIDAFLGRQGILPEEINDFIQRIKPFQNIQIEAVYSHFANIEDTNDPTHALKQIECFKQAVQLFRTEISPEISSHISATSGILVHEFNGGSNNFARLGIGLYGMWPSENLRIQNSDLALLPALRWVSHIAQVKTVPEDFSIGYGLTYVTNKPTKVAVIPQGYSDGYDRGLSNKGEVLIQGTRCKVLGRVAMNMFVVDVSHLDTVQAEDEVVLLGKQGDSEISAEEIARNIDTINYEITTRISATLPRVAV